MFFLTWCANPAWEGAREWRARESDGTRSTYPRSPAVDTTDGLIESFRGIFCFIVKVKGTTQQIIYWRACTSLLCQTICQSSGPAHVTAAPGRLLSVTSAASSYTNIAINPCMNINRLGERARERERERDVTHTCWSLGVIIKRRRRRGLPHSIQYLHLSITTLYRFCDSLSLTHTRLYSLYSGVPTLSPESREKFFGIYFSTTRGTNKSTFITYTYELEYTVRCYEAYLEGNKS